MESWVKIHKKWGKNWEDAGVQGVYKIKEI